MEKEVFLTKEGYDKLKREYDELSSTGRKEMAEKIKIAREFGDLSENAEYDAAKDSRVSLKSAFVKSTKCSATARLSTKARSIPKPSASVAS